MATVKLGLTDLPATVLVAKAQGLWNMLTAHAATFPAPVPSLAEFRAEINALAAANAAVDANGGKSDHLAKRTAVEAVRAAIKSLGGYVQAASGGNESKILLSGFEVVKRGGSIGELAPPQQLSSRITNREGRVSFRWKGDRGAEVYHVFMSTTNSPFTWELIGATTKCRFHADSLGPATLYWFAVSAVGAAGESSKSEPLLARAA